MVPKLCFCNATGKHNSDPFQERLLAIEGCHSSGETSQGCQRACGHGWVWYGVWGGSDATEGSSRPRAPLSSQPAIYFAIRWWSSHRWTKQCSHVTPALRALSCRGGCLSLSLKDPEGASAPDPHKQHSRGPVQHLKEPWTVAEHVFPRQIQSSGQTRKEAGPGEQRRPEKTPGTELWWADNEEGQEATVERAQGLLQALPQGGLRWHWLERVGVSPEVVWCLLLRRDLWIPHP